MSVTLPTHFFILASLSVTFLSFDAPDHSMFDAFHFPLPRTAMVLYHSCSFLHHFHAFPNFGLVVKLGCVPDGRVNVLPWSLRIIRSNFRKHCAIVAGACFSPAHRLSDCPESLSHILHHVYVSMQLSTNPHRCALAQQAPLLDWHCKSRMGHSAC